LSNILLYNIFESIIIKLKKMKLKKLKLGMLFLLYLGLTGIYAQESINATGGNALGSGGSVSYSIGQIVYQTNSDAIGSVAEGVQQPFEISIITSTEEAKNINLMVTAYPNPSTDYLILHIDGFDISNLSYHLYDMQGKLLHNEHIVDNSTMVSVNSLKPAIYFIKVYQKNKEVKTFKIIKN